MASRMEELSATCDSLLDLLKSTRDVHPVGKPLRRLDIQEVEQAVKKTLVEIKRLAALLEIRASELMNLPSALDALKQLDSQVIEIGSLQQQLEDVKSQLEEEKKTSASLSTETENLVAEVAMLQGVEGALPSESDELANLRAEVQRLTTENSTLRSLALMPGTPSGSGSASQSALDMPPPETPPYSSLDIPEVTPGSVDSESAGPGGSDDDEITSTFLAAMEPPADWDDAKWQEWVECFTRAQQKGDKGKWKGRIALPAALAQKVNVENGKFCLIQHLRGLSKASFAEPRTEMCKGCNVKRSKYTYVCVDVETSNVPGKSWKLVEFHRPGRTTT